MTGFDWHITTLFRRGIQIVKKERPVKYKHEKEIMYQIYDEYGNVIAEGITIEILLDIFTTYIKGVI